MIELKIINNFLPEKEFESINKLFMDEDHDFPWYYNDFICHDKDGLFQFVHMFFTPNRGPVSKHLPIWNNFIVKAGSNQNKCRRIKSNLTLKTKEPRIEEYKLTEEDEIMIPLLINQAINNINVLCSLANTKEDWKRLVTPNPDDWKWNDEDKQKARKEIWGY